MGGVAGVASPTMTINALVYVVDDDEPMRKALARLIRSAGLDVEVFPSAEAFLQREVTDRPCCLVLDVRLPGPSGLDLQAHLGRAQRTMPIIFITGHGTVPASVRAMKEGALDFLEKPFDDRELLANVSRALARSRDAHATDAECNALQRRRDSLTPRERQVLHLVVTGMLNKQIAAELGAAEKTIKVHRGRVMRKMQADSVAELVRMVQKLGQDDPPETKAP
jgi:FixJ family two-component response regulator